MDSFSEYQKQVPHYTIPQSNLETYFRQLKYKPKSTLELLENQYETNEDNITTELNLFSCIAFSESKIGDQRCTICNSNTWGESLYSCKYCGAKYCKPSCFDKHSLKCMFKGK
ncbi:Hypothetical_protein [Hexamita inflata]|uniref:Hypothetical_protein n=1 Tax=Hexamita inflata TaxID=28002 RepID=A0AA86PP17_9EUKA|nr:Hypothetical protein HINF_LOCUS11266 [Hexamita inflata]CAI9938930.1 Hypothetical protein HINF_LOCUS26575 [Hexamita inflata]